LAANGALLARAGFERHSVAVTAVGFTVVAIAAAVWLLAQTSYAGATTRLAGHLIAGRRHAVLATAVFVGALSAIDLGVIATS
jgi:hypothetical protein